MDVQRELGAIPVSISTAYPLETLGVGRVPKIEFVYVNIDTLLRNFYASLTAIDNERMNLETTLMLFKDELRIVADTLADQGRSFIFYRQNLNELPFIFPNAILKKPRTEKQIKQDAKQKIVLAHLDYELKVNQDTINPGIYHSFIDVLYYDKKLPGKTVPTVVFTHYPHQLLSRFDFPRLYLLESRTGKIKGFDLFNTKLNSVREGDAVPFDSHTLQLMGDTAIFTGYPSKIKKEFKAIGERVSWSSVTSPTKMGVDIQKYGSKELIAAYREVSTARQ